MDAATKAVEDLLGALGIDEGEHTADTPARVARAWGDMLWGYRSDPAEHLNTTFPAPEDPGLIIQAGIDVQSICAHHLLPFGGTATVAYRPMNGQRVVGLSKLTRVVYGYSARAQIQERIGQQVADAIRDRLNPEGVAVIISASHDCIRLRGARSPASMTTTVARRGVISSSDMDLIQHLHLKASSG
ncbi:MAG: GTP cyclohydrolase I [Planctomycetota bacterium]